MPMNYWLIHANGSRQRIDPRLFDLDALAEQARKQGARLIVEGLKLPQKPPRSRRRSRASGISPTGRIDEPRTILDNSLFEPPVSALGRMFRMRLEQIHQCKEDYELEMSTRPTNRVLGGYYRSRVLIRIYTHDSETGRRPLGELFETFLHEAAHHLEYTEPATFFAKGCGRVRGRMHSPLFWRILGRLKDSWAEQAEVTEVKIVTEGKGDGVPGA